MCKIEIYHSSYMYLHNYYYFFFGRGTLFLEDNKGLYFKTRIIKYLMEVEKI